MAHDVIFETDNALTRKKWARDLYKILLPSVEFNFLVGGADSPIEIKNDLSKGEGDTIKFGIRKPLTGEGVVGQDELEGNEEKLKFSNFYVTVEELNHAVDTGGKMDEQRIPYNLLQEAKSALNDWWAEKLSQYIMAVLCSDTTFTIAGKSFGPTIVAPDSKHWMCVGSSSDGASATETAMTAADYMDLTFLDKMKQKAEMMNSNGANYYKVRPLKIGGKNYYRVILHNYCFDILRQNMNAGQWGDIVRAGQKLQLPNVEFEYNGLIVSKSERVCKAPTNANVYRNVLLGAQAACWAWGGAGDSKSSTMSFVPYKADADRFVMVRGGGIFGCQKARFDSIDYGIIVGSAYGAAL